jgi:hypothetical protein
MPCPDTMTKLQSTVAGVALLVFAVLFTVVMIGR